MNLKLVEWKLECIVCVGIYMAHIRDNRLIIYVEINAVRKDSIGSQWSTKSRLNHKRTQWTHIIRSHSIISCVPL